jgi:hypothetical protein
VAFSNSGLDAAARRMLYAKEAVLKDQIVEHACCEVPGTWWINP